MILRIDHVSLAVRDLEKAEKFFSDLLGLVPGGMGGDEDSGYVYNVYSAGDLSRFEIISPSADKSFLDNFLKNREGGVHHITFQVKDIHKAKSILEKKKIPYFGFSDQYSNWKELYIHPKDAFGVLIQFAEFSPADWLDESMNVRDRKKWFVKKNGNRTILSVAHPGGGKVDIELSPSEINELIRDLGR